MPARNHMGHHCFEDFPTIDKNPRGKFEIRSPFSLPAPFCSNTYNYLPAVSNDIILHIFRFTKNVELLAEFNVKTSKLNVQKSLAAIQFFCQEDVAKFVQDQRTKVSFSLRQKKRMFFISKLLV